MRSPPQTFFIDRRGVIRARAYGPPSAAALDAEVGTHQSDALSPDGPVTPPSGTSGPPRAARATAQTSRTTSVADREGPGSQHRRARTRTSAAAGSAVATASIAVGQLGQRVRHAAEEHEDEEQPVGRSEVRLGPQRPGHEHPDAGERDGADEQQHDARR